MSHYPSFVQKLLGYHTVYCSSNSRLICDVRALAETEQRHEQSRDLKSDQLKSCHELVLCHDLQSGSYFVLCHYYLVKERRPFESCHEVKSSR